tara:strand:- start:13 stop:177 length:165 start_codon:yes stop_codon:yes gene_type:complete
MGHEIFASDLKVNEFCNVRAVIANPLEILCHEKHVRSGTNRAGIFDHVGYHLAK